MKTILTAATTSLLLSAGVVQAMDAELPWTLEEFLAAYPNTPVEVFTQLDTNGDGLLDQAELEAGIELGIIEPAEG